MNNKEQHIWTLPSKGLKAIFDEEIRGQISDGAWENTLPFNHWHFWSTLDTQVGNDWAFKFNRLVPSNDKYPRKKTAYNLVGQLLDPEVIDLSYRMRAYYVDAELGLGLGQDAEFLVTSNGVIKSLDDVRSELKRLASGFSSDYWNAKLAKIENVLPRLEEFQKAYEAYTRKHLINDLRLLKKQMKIVINAALA
jgi:hypothetical protein